MEIEGLSYHSKTTHLRNLKSIMRLRPEIDYLNLTEDDIQKVLIAIVKNYLNPKTVSNLKISLRKWLQVSNQSNLLDKVKATSGKTNGKLPEDMLTQNKLEKLLSNCSHPRDAAIIALLYDSGCRIGELLSMKVRDVEFDDNGAIVTFPEGKTGWRKNRVVYASAYLRQWIECHEYSQDKESPMFYSLRGKIIDSNKRSVPENRELNRLTAEAVRRQLKIIAYKAGIKRRIHPHLFRHTRATELANHLTEQQLKKQFGWTQSSNMAAQYVHLSDRDVDKAILKASGVEISEDEQNMPTSVKCPRCRELNPPHAAYCLKCGLLLSQPMTDKNEQYVQELLAALQKNPEVLLKYLSENR